VKGRRKKKKETVGKKEERELGLRADSHRYLSLALQIKKRREKRKKSTKKKGGREAGG